MSFSSIFFSPGVPQDSTRKKRITHRCHDVLKLLLANFNVRSAIRHVGESNGVVMFVTDSDEDSIRISEHNEYSRYPDAPEYFCQGGASD